MPLENGSKRHSWEIKHMKEITYLVRCELQYQPLQILLISLNIRCEMPLVSHSPLRRMEVKVYLP